MLIRNQQPKFAPAIAAVFPPYRPFAFRCPAELAHSCPVPSAARPQTPPSAAPTPHSRGQQATLQSPHYSTTPPHHHALRRRTCARATPHYSTTPPHHHALRRRTCARSTWSLCKMPSLTHLFKANALALALLLLALLIQLLALDCLSFFNLLAQEVLVLGLGLAAGIVPGLRNAGHAARCTR